MANVFPFQVSAVVRKNSVGRDRVLGNCPSGTAATDPAPRGSWVCDENDNERSGDKVLRGGETVDLAVAHRPLPGSRGGTESSDPDSCDSQAPMWSKDRNAPSVYGTSLFAWF